MAKVALIVRFSLAGHESFRTIRAVSANFEIQLAGLGPIVRKYANLSLSMGLHSPTKT